MVTSLELGSPYPIPYQWNPVCPAPPSFLLEGGMDETAGRIKWATSLQDGYSGGGWARSPPSLGPRIDPHASEVDGLWSSGTELQQGGVLYQFLSCKVEVDW